MVALLKAAGATRAGHVNAIQLSNGRTLRIDLVIIPCLYLSSDSVICLCSEKEAHGRCPLRRRSNLPLEYILPTMMYASQMCFLLLKLLESGFLMGA